MTEKRFRVTISNTNTVYFVDFENKQLMSITFKNKSNAIDCKNVLMYQCDLLNTLHEENQDLRIILNQCRDQRNEFHRGARENANRVGKLEKENEQLRQQLQNFQ